MYGSDSVWSGGGRQCLVLKLQHFGARHAGPGRLVAPNAASFLGKRDAVLGKRDTVLGKRGTPSEEEHSNNLNTPMCS